MSKRPDTDPIVLDDIDPNSEWVVETQPPEFGDDIDVELEDLLDVSLDADPLLPMPSVHTCVDAERTVPGMAGTSRSGPCTYSRRRRRHSASTTTSLADDFDPEEPETEPDHDAFASPSGSSSSSSSSSGAEFDDDH